MRLAAAVVPRPDQPVELTSQLTEHFVGSTLGSAVFVP